jgi:DtxR family transcriptional regulator, Mn-dependent transcriptional regulator
MLPSSTVENYLKAIYQGVNQLNSPARLLPMGQLAAALGVTPGTATTMVKTLAESGLVEYEPYSGVALTPAGERLAALVLRRHRLIELFLVRVVGYSWDDVHEEAEQLEHAVSDRLIDRIDEMLGRPEADPHGDPIPNSEGQVKTQDVQTLLSCPLNTPVTVTRVIDQDKVFLRFIEQNDLKPGQSIEVEDRDAAADSVRVRGKNDRLITIGTRAASKLLVQVARTVLVLLTTAAAALAQTPASGSDRPFEITDNSLLIEEAFNQEPGVFQNILLFHRAEDGGWELGFTQEWPLFSQTHQISYTIPVADVGPATGIGDVMVHYRLQATRESGAVPAFSPRVSIILPTGDAGDGLGGGRPAWQMNFPFSKQLGDAYFHWAAGFTHSPQEEAGGTRVNLFSPQVSGSAIWRVRPMLNLLLEAAVEWSELAENGVTRREASTILSPGFRTGWNSGDKQTIVGIGLPIEFGGDRTDVGVFGYFSYELPFVRLP